MNSEHSHWGLILHFLYFQALDIFISCVNVVFLFGFCTFLNNTIFFWLPYCICICICICIRPEFSSSVLHKMFQKSCILLISLVSILLTGSCHIMSAKEKFQTATLYGINHWILNKHFAWQNQHLTNRQKEPKVPAAPHCFNFTPFLKHIWLQPEQS